MKYVRGFGGEYTVSIKFYAPYGIVLRVLDLDIKRDLEEVLRPIGAEIRSAVEAADEAQKKDDDWGIDDELELIEMSLGICFVVAQTQIARVISHARRLHEWHEHHSKRKILLGIEGFRKDEMLGVVTSRIGGSTHTAVEGINAFANYFKHRDEWPADWTQLRKRNEIRTAAVIRKFGAEPGRSGNLKRGYKSLFGDAARYNEVPRIVDAVRDWARALKTAYEQELRAGGFLPDVTS